jgi:hypothetical protein
MGAIYSIQQANTESGEYDVHESIPYPYHVETDGKIGRQDLWQGDPEVLVGFQAKAHVQEVDLLWQVAVSAPEKIPGMFPVFCRSNGSFYSSSLPVERVTVTHEDHSQEHYPEDHPTEE